MITFISPGASGTPPIGQVGFLLSEDEARELRDVLTHALNHLGEPGIKAWFTYGDVRGEADTPTQEDLTAEDSQPIPSPFKELEDQ